MKTEIYYFSGTGNSLAIAKKITNEIENCTIISISKLMEKSDHVVSAADRIGIVFPVYCHLLPMQVEQFLKIFDIEKKSYIFTITTHNGEYGRCAHMIKTLLKRKNLSLHYSNHIKMPGNSIFADGYTNTKEEQLKRLRESETSVKIIAADINKQKHYLYDNPDHFFDKIKTNLMYWALKNILKVENKFHTKDTCTGCGVCVKVCPKNNIKISKNLVSWGKSCEYCLACIHWCPSKAIQIDNGTEKRIRYHHPDININDISYR